MIAKISRIPQHAPFGFDQCVDVSRIAGRSSQPDASSRSFWQSIREQARLVHAIDAMSWSPGTGGLFYISYVTDPDKRVQNRRDPDATSLLIAHTEYWKNDTVMQAIYDAIGAE